VDATRGPRRPSMPGPVALWIALWVGWGRCGASLWTHRVNPCAQRVEICAGRALTCSDAAHRVWRKEKSPWRPMTDGAVAAAEQFVC